MKRSSVSDLFQLEEFLVMNPYTAHELAIPEFGVLPFTGRQYEIQNYRYYCRKAS